jgi:hypothetical protein
VGLMGHSDLREKLRINNRSLVYASGEDETYISP